MAQYQVGSSRYEIPDNLSEQQLNAVLTQLAAQEKQQPQQGTDGAFAYSVDKAQEMLGKGVEVAGDLVGSQTIKDYGTSVVEQQRKDIEAGGYKPTYTGTLRDTYANGGFGEALGWIAEKSAENAASGGAALAGTGLAALALPFSVPVAVGIGGTTLVGSGLMGAGEAAMEMEDKTGSYDPKTAAGVGVVVGLLDKFGAGKIIPRGALMNMTGQEVVEALIKAGKDDAALAIGKRILKSTGFEAGTETLQEGAVMAGAATQGAEYSTDELIDRPLEALVLGGTMGGTTTTAIEGTQAIGRGAKELVNMSADELTPSELAARVDFANRMSRIAEANNFSLKNIGKMGAKGAVDAVDNAHTEIVKDIDLAIEGLRQDINSTLSTQKGDSEERAAIKALARLGIKNARNKVKGVVTADQIAAVEQLAGTTTEGQKLINLMREANELTSLHKSGYVGGVSQYTDLLSPLGSNAGYDRGAAATERLLRPLLTGGAAFQTGGTSLALQGGLAATGRIIDAVTGRRSRVAKFIKDYKGGQGQQVSATASARARGLAAWQRKQDEIARAKAERARLAAQRKAEAAAREAQKREQERQEREMNEALYNDGTRQRSGYTPTSPQQTLLDATGMDLKNIEIVLRELVSQGLPIYSQGARAALKSLKQGGRIGPSDSNLLSNLIRLVNDRVDSGNTAAQMVKQRDEGSFSKYGESEAIKKGIEENKKAAEKLIDRVQTDPDLDEFTKDVITKKLEIFRDDNLGLDPLGRAQQELADALDQLSKAGMASETREAAVNRYLGAYIQRIEIQQRAREKAKQGQGQPQPQPQPPQPQPEPQPDLDKTTPIVSTVTPNFTVPDKDASLQDLTKQLKEAKNDQRHIDHWGRAREDIAGQANLGGAFTPEAVALIAAVKPEIDAICDRFGVPRIRGMKSIKSNASTVARMGGGIMSFNPRYFNDWAALGNRASLDGNTVQGGKTVDYDPNVTFADRPYNNFMYYGTGIDRVRQVMYHEIGHHIHQMAFSNKTDAYGKPVVDANGNSMVYLNDTEIEMWLVNHKRDILNVNTKDALPSRYAAYNEKEWWCENFSEYFMGHKERSVPQFISLIESILLKGDLSDA